MGSESLNTVEKVVLVRLYGKLGRFPACGLFVRQVVSWRLIPHGA